MEILNVYTEVDPSNRITTTTRRVTWANIVRDEVAYVYTDKGVGRFSGNFVHLLTIKTVAIGNGMTIGHWVMANVVGSYKELLDANADAFFVTMAGGATTVSLSLVERDGVSTHGDEYVANRDVIEGTIYYLKIVRDESDGDHGTLYCYIYSDAARTTLVDTLSVALLTSKKNFRYIYAFQSYGITADTATATGYTENLDLSTTLFEVTTQPVTSITETTAIGNGIIVDLGIATVTAHGHCWATTIDPTLSDTSVDNGEGSLGAYTTSMQNLVAGQQYYVRAFITSTEGTVYGANVVFTAGYISTQLIAGNLAVVQGRLQYIGADGIERYITGAKV